MNEIRNMFNPVVQYGLRDNISVIIVDWSHGSTPNTQDRLITPHGMGTLGLGANFFLQFFFPFF